MRRILATALLLNLLFIALSLPAYPTMPWITAEALLLVGLFSLLAGHHGRWRAARKALAYTVAVLYGSLVLCAAGEALIRQSLGRSLNLYLDLGLLRSVYNLLTTNLDSGLAILAVLLATSLFLGLIILIAQLLMRLAAASQAQASLAVVCLVAGALALMLSPTLRLPVGAVAVGTVKQQFVLAFATQAATEEFKSKVLGDNNEQASPTGGPSQLAGNDVILGFIESYGISTLTDPRYEPLIGARLQEMQRALAEAGLSVVSGRLRSPVQGGQSWLAHGTTLSGLWVDSQLDYEVLLASDYPTLVDDFRQSGHHTVAIMPAITRDWPEGRQFGYDRIYDAQTMAYQGPALNWVTMPDQYTWSWLQRVRDRTAAPLFAEVALISSHAPWVPILPVLQNWDGIGSGKVFNLWKGSGEAPDSLWRDHDRVRGHYARSVDYALKVVTEYAVRHVNERTLLMVLGDHQPAPLITGKDASREVPVHLISADPSLLAPFMGRSPVSTSADGHAADALPTFQDGTRPAPVGEAPRMDEFRPFLLRRFAAPEQSTDHVAQP